MIGRLINPDENALQVFNIIMNTQERRRKLSSLDESKQYQCFVCFQRLIDPRKCEQCRKILCGGHIPNLKNRCPNCRMTPFKAVTDDTLNIVLKCLKRQEWESLGKENVHNCKIQRCPFTGNYVGMIKHRKKSHPGNTIEELMQGTVNFEENQRILAKLLKKLRVYKITIQTLSAVENTLQSDNPLEKKKHPPHVFARQMATHINECSSSQCRKMWNVKWGSYIGSQGEEVEGQFYLSECPVGKEINERLGWDYSNPLY